MIHKGRAAIFIMSILSSLAATAVLQSGCTGSGHNAGPGSTGAAVPNPLHPQKQTVYSVTTTEVREQRMENYIKINGDVVAETSVSVYPDIEGKVSRIMVRVGDYVRKDQAVAMVDPSKPGSSYKESPVKATITGTVTDVVADLGQNVSTSVPVVELGSLDTLQVEARVPERFIGSVAVGKRAVLTFEPYPGEQFNARVVEVSPALSASSRTLHVTLEFDDPKNLIKVGMFAGIRLVTEVHEKALAVPSDSIVTRDGERVVFVLDTGDSEENPTVSARSVQTGMSADEMTEIIEGVAPGDIVVTAGQTLLKNGAQVTVVENSDETAAPGEGGSR
jgi:multidrug efflux pump subunit AcrA (membrane-fusion protein)